jgi:mRNA interferase HigB
MAHVIAKPRLRAFWEEHRDAQAHLEAWYKVARKAQWTCLADLRTTFPTADQVGRCLIFDICGNKYRLIVRPTRNWRRLYIRCILIHKEYDRGKWKKDCSD